MRVPALDLKAEFAMIGRDVRAAIDEVLESQLFVMGPAVADLEQRVALYCECKEGVGLSSGTDALLVALMALGIGVGDEVVTSPYTFFATAGAVARLGARPVFVDIDPVTYCIDPHHVEAAITPRTRAMIPVHLYGQCADMDPLLALAKERGIPVVEDAAQAIGATYRGRKAGSLGDIGCFSFFPSKNLGAYGDAGLTTTNDAELASAMRVLRQHGAQPKYFHKRIGGNFRLDTIQAAILRAKLPHLEGWHARRNEIASRYAELLSGADALGVPVVAPGRGHVFNQYVVRIAGGRRDAVAARLRDAGIDTAVYYPRPLHLQECFSYLGYVTGSMPEAERAAAETLALPMHPFLSYAQVERVAEQIRVALGAR